MIFFLVLFTVVNQRWFWEKAAARALTQGVQGLRIKDVSITFLNIRWPRQFSFAEAEFSGTLHSKVVKGSFNKLEVRFESFHQAEVTVNGLSFNARDMEGENARFTGKVSWNQKGLRTLSGPAAVKKLWMKPYLITDIGFDVSGNDQDFLFTGLWMNFCEGEISGRAKVSYAPRLFFDVSLTLKSVNLARLEETKAPYFSYARGIVNGNLELKTDLSVIDHFMAELETVEQAQMKASIINFIVQAAGVKEKLFDERFAAMVEKDEFVPLRAMRAKIVNLNQNELRAQMDFQPRDYNVRVNAPVDIRVDEKVLESIFKRHKVTASQSHKKGYR